MAAICIFYAREDRSTAEWLYNLLSPRWDIWWDDMIVGEFAEAIETEIPKAQCVIPLFSASSRSKSTFTDELRLAKKCNKTFLPIKLDDSTPPYSFGDLSSVDFRGWRGEVNHPAVRQLLHRLASVIPASSPTKRPSFIISAALPLPALFPSVSSYDTQLKPPDAAVRALRVFKAPAILVSAYDLVARRKPQALIRELDEYRKGGGFVLVDSGNYEASRLGNRRWKVADLREALEQAPHDWAFCFDVMNPSSDPSEAVDEIVAAVGRDQLLTKAPVLPIVHAPKINSGYDLFHIPRVIREVSERLKPPLVAIPERELGPGLIARAKTVQRIRSELNKLDIYQPLHILGTGNPWSIAILAAAGADSFDGLEWCRMAVDREKDRLHHFHHFDFFSWQSRAESSLAKDALDDPDIDFAGKVAFHNLEYYAHFIKSMREFLDRNSMEAFVERITNKSTADQIKKEIPGILK